MTEENRLDVGPEDAEVLGVAAVVGEPELAVELERLGLSDEDEALTDARELRRLTLDVIEALRRLRTGEEAGEETDE